jgi:hypothetical protein
MDSKSAFIFAAIGLVAGVVFMLAAWVRFERIESKLTEHETKIYVIDLVQAELMDRQGLHVEVTGAESAVGEWHSPISEMTHITIADQDSDEESAKRPTRNKRRRGD